MDILNEAQKVAESVDESTERFFVRMWNKVEFFKDKEDGWEPYVGESTCDLCGCKYVQSNVELSISGGELGLADGFLGGVCDICATATPEELKERIEGHITRKKCGIMLLKLVLERGIDTLDVSTVMAGKYGTWKDDLPQFRTEDVRRVLWQLKWDLEQSDSPGWWHRIPEEVKSMWWAAYAMLAYEWSRRTS